MSISRNQPWLLTLIKRKTVGTLQKTARCYSEQLVELMDASEGSESLRQSPKRIKLYNTYTKVKEDLNAKLVVNNAVEDDLAKIRFLKTYCCGPTVYDDCHLGHALTYTRFDILRRVLKAYCETEMIVAMGITDIDDKILRKAEQLGEANFQVVSEKYFNSFVNDMKSLNILPPHFYMKVTENVNNITKFIRKMEDLGAAYLSEESQDVNFDSSKVSVYAGVAPVMTEKSKGKNSPRDFALWKSAKPGEPNWDYTSSSGIKVPGRPGWHVECSAMGSIAFGSSIDVHYGGKDLIFPHHYNEAACCYVYHELSQEMPVHGWSNLWLHSGHLVMQQEVSCGDENHEKNCGVTHGVSELRQMTFALML